MTTSHDRSTTTHAATPAERVVLRVYNDEWGKSRTTVGPERILEIHRAVSSRLGMNVRRVSSIIYRHRIA